MRVFAPNYYKDFKCIADKCKHNCCIGWEIGIDKNTFELYNSMGGAFGERFKKSIFSDNEGCYFILKNDKRCPFLNDNNLCDIILNLGEDKLCDICSDHPRFRNHYSEFAEIGVGMCCEAAAKLILNSEPKTKISQLAENDKELFLTTEEEVFLNFRERVFEILQNRELPVKNRICELLSKCNTDGESLKFAQWADVYLSLENLDKNWMRALEITKENLCKDNFCKELEIPFEQLLIYFVYRHLSDGIYDGMLRERLAFAVLSFNITTEVFGALSEKEILSIQGVELLAEIARMYSSEVEYCEENTDKILELLNEKIDSVN